MNNEHVFVQETQQLQWKQNWYQQNQTTMTKEEEEEYVSYCSEAMFRIHILEERLNRLDVVFTCTCTCTCTFCQF